MSSKIFKYTAQTYLCSDATLQFGLQNRALQYNILIKFDVIKSIRKFALLVNECP